MIDLQGVDDSTRREIISFIRKNYTKKQVRYLD